MRSSLKNKTTRTIALAVGLTTAGLATSAVSAELPSSMIWTAYGTTSSGYAQSVAISNMLKQEFGTSVRVLPGKNDISRMTPLKVGKADYCACGIASYFGQEGVMQFATADWGPQPLRVLLTAKGTFGLGLAVTADSGIKTVADIKGKRIAWVRGADGLNLGAEATIAFAGLTWDDVEKVEFPGFKDSIDGMINGQVDASFGSTVTPHYKRLAASPRGIHWPTLSADDTEGWKRLHEVAPYFSPLIATSGAEITKEKPWEGKGYPYPIMVTNADKSADEVYALTKAMIEKHDVYKNSAPGAAGWALESQKMEWILPYHEGTVKYFKEIGVWTDAAQAHNDGLIKRQDVLMKAYAAYKDTKPSDDEFRAGWTKARAEALVAAGLPIGVK
ncbi:TAXI family TRAP transporter solute-binding subunit [Sneathiella chinensis]|uniref:C4-dicarboxylate ABC transporter n=1 Tax=Sneathiella chinensis TaxID=349750 RepID=A0ABQ5U1Q3_9PROT|nr:TAXI family TRAP transporter solute-binding subunit [Sneathiella chinensis]GLQ05600.1 C4-dicarboxylate ABC transporter [Sneathiella chinensis]